MTVKRGMHIKIKYLINHREHCEKYSIFSLVKKEERKEQSEKPAEMLRQIFRFGAGGRGRTGTVSLPLDFESSTSANSITPAK